MVGWEGEYGVVDMWVGFIMLIGYYVDRVCC